MASIAGSTPIKRRDVLLAALTLVAITLIFHLGILANPGFFNHDEWQKFDHVQQHGYKDFALAYGQVYAGPEFGFPIRPLGFLQQGATSMWMEEAPVLTHLFDVVLHASIAVIVLVAMVNLGASLPFSSTVGLLFALSPLTTLATGWVGASFDQWFALFAFLASWLTYRAAVDGLNLRGAVGLLLAALGAILSKETSLILPGVALLAAIGAAFIHGKERIRWGAVGSAIAIILVPLIAYLMIRFPAIANSLAGKSNAAYTPSLGNVVHNLGQYFAYPFAANTVEVAVAPDWFPVMVAAHSLLIIALWSYFGARYAALYLASYLVFVIPVLPVRISGSHYLYGASLPLAIGLSAVLFAGWRRGHRLTVLLSLAGAAALFVHSIGIQSSMYKDGLCQATFLATLDSRMDLERSRGSEALVVIPEPGARDYVGQRSIFGRERYSGAQGISVRFERPGSQSDAGGAVAKARMTPACQVR